MSTEKNIFNATLFKLVLNLALSYSVTCKACKNVDQTIHKIENTGLIFEALLGFLYTFSKSPQFATWKFPPINQRDLFWILFSFTTSVDGVNESTPLRSVKRSPGSLLCVCNDYFPRNVFELDQQISHCDFGFNDQLPLFIRNKLRLKFRV